MKEKNQITLDEFIKLLNYYKDRINITYKDDVKNNDNIDTVEEAVIQKKLEPIQEQMNKSYLDFDEENPVEIKEAENNYDLALNITDANGNQVTYYKSNDPIPTKNGVTSNTYFETVASEDNYLLEQIEEDHNLKKVIDKTFTNESIDLFFNNSYYMIEVQDLPNQETYVLKFNLNEQFLIKQVNNKLKEVELNKIPNKFYSALTMEYEDLPIVFKRIYEEFQAYDNSLINKLKFTLQKIKK